MKPINCPIEQEKYKSYLRCVNKDTLEYVDVPISRGRHLDKHIYLLNNADEMSGNWNVFSGKDKKEYHYGILFTKDQYFNLEENVNGNVVGFIIKDGAAYALNINKNTNEIISIENKICDI